MSRPRNVSFACPAIAASLEEATINKKPRLCRRGRVLSAPDWMRKSGDLQVACRRASGALVSDNLIGDLLPFVEFAEPRALNGADMDKHVLAAVVRLDETKAFRCVEPFDGSRSHRCSPVRSS